MLALVVDNSADSRRTLREILRNLGIETLEAAKAPTAISVLGASLRPEVVFCRPPPDVCSPELIQRLHNLGVEHDLPVVAVFEIGAPVASPFHMSFSAWLTEPQNREAVIASLSEAGLQLPVSVQQSAPHNSVSSADVTPETDEDAISVLVVDPAAFVRQLLSKVIRECPGFTLAATAQLRWKRLSD